MDIDIIVLDFIYFRLIDLMQILIQIWFYDPWFNTTNTKPTKLLKKINVYKDMYINNYRKKLTYWYNIFLWANISIKTNNFREVVNSTYYLFLKFAHKSSLIELKLWNFRSIFFNRFYIFNILWSFRVMKIWF